MLYEEQVFGEQIVDLDENNYRRCLFERSILVYSGATPVHMESNTFMGINFAFNGPALNTIVFLASLYQQGGQVKEAVEALFQQIRKGLLPM